MHCARAVHVQAFWPYCCFGASTGQTAGTGDAKLAGHMHTAFVVNVVMGCKLRAPEAEHFFDVESSGLRKL